MRSMLIAGLLAALASSAAGAGDMIKYKVTTKAAKHTDFAKLKTYEWENGWQAYDEVSHQQIVAAVDRELAALGFSKSTSGTSDVTVTYATVRRADVDLKSKARGPNGERPTYPVATLVVVLREPGTHRNLFRGRADTPIELIAEANKSIIDDRVQQIFARYPTRH